MGKDKARAKQIAIKRGKKQRMMAEGTASLGAAKDCLFRIEGTGINDHHVNLEFNGAVLTVSPTKEAEGITLNGKPLSKPEQVKTGDILAFGTHSFEVGPISNAPGAFRRALRRWYIRVPLYGAAAILLLLLIAFVIAWIYFSPARVSGLITENIDNSLNCKSKIGSLDYSFGGHVVINDFSIEDRMEYSSEPILKVAKLETKISIWDLISKKVRLNLTATDPVVNLRRKMIAGKPSWNIEAFKPVPPPPGTTAPSQPPSTTAPGPTQPPPVPVTPGQPIDIGLSDLVVSITVSNLQVNVDDELMKRKTQATMDLSATTDGGGKPFNVDLNCRVDSNGRSGKIALKAEANLFTADGKLDLFTATPPRLTIRAGDMVSSLPLQAVLDHITAPLKPTDVFADTALPIEPNLMGSPLVFPVSWPNPDEKLPPITASVSLAHLDDLSVGWQTLTVRTIQPIAIDLAGTVDVSGVGKHRDPLAAPMPAGSTAVDTAWVDGDKLHLDLKKISFDAKAQTLAVDTAVTFSNAKQGQILHAQVTTSASQIDLDALASTEPATKEGAIRKIKWDHPQIQVSVDTAALVGSGIGQLALTGRKDLVANWKSGTINLTVNADGDLSDSLHLITNLKVDNVGMAISADSNVTQGGLNLALDMHVGLGKGFMPDHVEIAVLSIDSGMGGKTFPLCDIENVKIKGLAGALKGNLGDLVVTADKMQPLMISKEFVDQINPLLKAVKHIELHDLVQVNGEFNVAGMKGGLKVDGRIDRIDPEHSALSAAARQPITFEISVDFRQLPDQRKQLSLDITSGFGETIFHAGIDTPAFVEPTELATAPITFTAQQAPHLQLPLAPLLERLAAYLPPDLLLQIQQKINLAADPQLVLDTKKLEVNQAAGDQNGELRTLWECALGIHNLQDAPQGGKTILPEKTDFDFNILCNVGYHLIQLPPPPPDPKAKPGDTPAKGDLAVDALRVINATIGLKHKYLTLDYHLATGNVIGLTTEQKVPDQKLPDLIVVKLPDRFVETCQIRVQKEAYELARQLIKDKIALLPLTQNQQALTIDLHNDWDAADPTHHDTHTLRVESQIDPFLVDAKTAEGAGKTTDLLVQFAATGALSKLKLPLNPKHFDAVDYLFNSDASLDITVPLSIDQLVLLVHNNAITLHIQDEMINTINSPLSPITAGGKILSTVHAQFDGKGGANLQIHADMTDLYLQAKNEGALQTLTLVKEKQKIALLLHETRAQNPQTLPLSLALVATAQREGNTITVRLDDKDNVQHLGPLALSFGTTLTLAFDGAKVQPLKADYVKEMVLDCAQIAGLAPLATDLNLSGRLHVKSSAQNLDLKKLLPPADATAAAAPAAPAPAAPTAPLAPVAPNTTAVPASPGVPAGPAAAPAAVAPVAPAVAAGPQPLFDPNLNNATYEVFTAPDLAIEPKPADPKATAANKIKLSLGIKSLSGDLGGNKTGEIILGLAATHTTAIHLADLRALAKPEQPSFMQALSTFSLRVNAKVFNTEDQPLHVLEFTNAIQACTHAVGIPDPPANQPAPPPAAAGTPLQPGALDFIQPLTANFELDLRHIIYDRYEVDSLKGKMLLDQGQFLMPEPVTAAIYKGSAKVDVLVNLVGPHPDIPKILVDVAGIDYNDFMTRAYASPDAVSGTMQVHIEGTGKSALAPDLDSLDLKIIRTISDKTEITDVNKLPLIGPLYAAAAEAFPTALPANPGKIPLGTQALKNGKLENGYLTFSEFPFHPTEGPLLGYEVVAEGRIHVIDAMADPVTFKITAVPPKVVAALVATARKELLVSINKGIPAKYQLTDADMDEADKDMRAKFTQFMADGHLYVRGRGPLSKPKPEMTSAKEISELLLAVGTGVLKKKVADILQKVAEDKAKEAVGNLLAPKKKK